MKLKMLTMEEVESLNDSLALTRLIYYPWGEKGLHTKKCTYNPEKGEQCILCDIEIILPELLKLVK